MPITAGKYHASVLSTRLSESKSGTPFIVVTFATINGEIDGWFCINERSLPYTIEKLDNIGWTGDDITELDESTILAGRECNIVVQDEEYDGKIRQKVVFVNKLGGNTKKVAHESLTEVNDYIKKLRSGAFKKNNKKDNSIN